MTIRTRIALGISAAALSLGFLFGLEFSRLRDRFLRFAGDPRGFQRGSLFLKTLLLGLFCLARCLRLGPLGREGLAFGALRRDRGIVGPGLRFELVQKI